MGGGVKVNLFGASYIPEHYLTENQERTFGISASRFILATLRVESSRRRPRLHNCIGADPLLTRAISSFVGSTNGLTNFDQIPLLG